MFYTYLWRYSIWDLTLKTRPVHALLFSLTLMIKSVHATKKVSFFTNSNCLHSSGCNFEMNKGSRMSKITLFLALRNLRCCAKRETKWFWTFLNPCSSQSYSPNCVNSWSSKGVVDSCRLLCEVQDLQGWVCRQDQTCTKCSEEGA